MLNINLNIRNPWSKRWKNIWNKVFFTPHSSKYIELEVFEDSTIISFGFSLTTRQDHSGLMIEFGLLGYSFSFNLYDIRHWNTEAGRYEIYNEEKGWH